jgi:uncharacterized tellurite resistance protein B-like protein
MEDAMSLEDFLQRFDNVEHLGDLNLQQNKAFLDVLILAVYADGFASEEEVTQIEAELVKLPFVADADRRDEVTSHGVSTRNLLEESFDDSDALGRFTASLAEVITAREHRIAAMQMFATICYTDGLDARELEVARLLGHALELSDDDVHDILEAVGTTAAEA